MAPSKKTPPGKQQAVALHYHQNGDGAPKVTATGQGGVAQAIMKRAREAGVPLVEDPDLVALLGKVPLGESVPPELYRAVAEVLAYVYRINRKFPA